MHRLVLICTVLAVLPGCDWLNNLTTDKPKNPVLGTPPPRIQMADRGTSPVGPQGSGYRNQDSVRPVSRELGGLGRNDSLSDSQIVATVNGKPILASDILDRYTGKLTQVRTQATPEQFRTVRENLIKRDLDEHIKRVLLVDALRSSLEKKQLQKLDEYIDGVFEERVVELKKEFKVDTRAELEVLLGKQGSSLESLRDSFANAQMASQFFKEKTESKQVIGRPEMMRYYNAHIADYKTTARIRWQEIQVSYAKHGGKSAAFSVVEKAVQALKNRDNFAAVAKKHSDGPTAKKGGQWGWTQIGSLADKKIERALFELPVNDISRVYTGEFAFKIVKINAREATRFTPFGEVQKEIKATLEQQARKANGKKVFEDLRKNAVITTMFDAPGRTEEPRVRTISNERPVKRNSDERPRGPNPFER